MGPAGPGMGLGCARCTPERDLARPARAAAVNGPGSSGTIWAVSFERGGCRAVKRGGAEGKQQRRLGPWLSLYAACGEMHLISQHASAGGGSTQEAGAEGCA
eukprot:3773624-Rhodomonas_salina.1